MSEDAKEFFDNLEQNAEEMGFEPIYGNYQTPDWWGEDEQKATFRIQLCFQMGLTDGKGVCELLKTDPTTLRTATHLWLLKAAMIISKEPPIVQCGWCNDPELIGEGRDEWFQIVTWALCVYADSLGIYTPNLAEFQVETQGLSQQFVEGDLVYDYEASNDTRALKRLYKLAVVEIQRIRAASPDYFPYAKQAIETKSANDDRDKFIYEQLCLNPRPSRGQIRKEVNKRTEWSGLQTDPAITRAGDRYATRHGLKAPPRE